MTNDLWVFLFQTIDAECIKWASSARIYAFIVNLNKCLKPFLLEQHINIESRFKAFGLSVDVMKNVQARGCNLDSACKLFYLFFFNLHDLNGIKYRDSGENVVPYYRQSKRLHIIHYT